MGWPHGSLRGRSGLDLVPDSMAGALAERLRAPSCARRPQGLAGPPPAGGDQARGRLRDPRRGRAVGVRASAGRPRRRRDLPPARRATAAALVRADERAARAPGGRADRRPAGGTAPLHARPTPRLGRHHAVDAGRPTAVWCAATSGRATPGVAPSFAEEKAADPTSGSDGLPALGHRARRADLAEPTWRTTSASPVTGWYGTASRAPTPSRSATAATVVGIVKMLGASPANRTFGVVELMDAVGGHLGELLHAVGPGGRARAAAWTSCSKSGGATSS